MVIATTTIQNTAGQLAGVLINYPTVPAGVVALRIDRTAEGRTLAVRGAIGIPADFPVLDLEVPTNTLVTYRAEMFNSLDMAPASSLGYSDPTTLTVEYEGTIIHNVLDPSRCVFPDLDTGTAAQIKRRTPGDLVYTEDASVPRRIGSRRQAIEDMPFIVETHTLEDADALASMVGGYGDDRAVAIWCIRTPGPAPRIPRLLFATMDSLVEEDVSVEMGGGIVLWPLSISEVLPPAPGLGISILSYDDIDYNYADYDLMDAAYSDYQAKDTDFSLAGTAP